MGESIISDSVIRIPVLRVPVTREPKNRTPVTLEILVEKINKDHDSEYHHKLLYDYTIKLFLKALNKPENYRFIKNRKYEKMVELAHEVYCLFLDQLKDYNPEKSRVSTWIYMLTNIYIGRKKRKIFADTYFKNNNEIEYSDNKSTHKRLVADIDFRNGIRRVIEQYPEEKDIAVEIFGNPDDKDYYPPNLKYTDIAERLDVSYHRVRNFFVKKAKPALMRYFR